MNLLWIVLGMVGAGIALLIVSRMNELFAVSIRGGRCLVVRGAVPPSVWRELRAVAAQAKIARGTVRAVKDGGRARLVCDGVDEGTAQRLRNALGSTGFGHLKASQPAACGSGSRNLGQLLGFAWLAWLLSGPRGD